MYQQSWETECVSIRNHEKISQQFLTGQFPGCRFLLYYQNQGMEEYRKSSNKRRGAYSKTFHFFAAPIIGQRLFEGGAYFKTW